MSRLPRRDLNEEPEVGIYHCVQRALRRAFLCGQDAVTGRNFDHRKAWIQQAFGVPSQAVRQRSPVFCRHEQSLHVVLRNRPDVIQEWSDQEVARRWWFLFPGRKDVAGQPEEPTAADLQMLTADEEPVHEHREFVVQHRPEHKASVIRHEAVSQNPHRNDQESLRKPRSEKSGQ